MFAVAACVAVAVVGLTPMSASALNPDSYNILKNAQRNQLCLDMHSELPAEGAPGQLWSCTHPVVAEQQFILVAPNFGQGPVPGMWLLKSERGNQCLTETSDGRQVKLSHCVSATVASWYLENTGEIKNVFYGSCLDATGDAKGAAVVTRSCNGSLSQRWFF
jgi:hypothetical protein